MQPGHTHLDGTGGVRRRDLFYILAAILDDLPNASDPRPCRHVAHKIRRAWHLRSAPAYSLQGPPPPPGLSIGVQTGPPPIGAQKGPSFEYGTTVEERAFRCARRREGGARPEARAARSILIPACGGGSVSVLEAPSVIAGLDDVAMVGDAIAESGGHLGVAEHGRPLPSVNCVSPNARLVVMMTLVCS